MTSRYVAGALRRQRDPVASSERRAKPFLPAWLLVLSRNLLLGLTAASVLLTLTSYGFEWALLDRFGVRPEQLNLSGSDYLFRSYRPVLAAFNRDFDGSAARLFASDERLGRLALLSYFLLTTGAVISAYLAANRQRQSFARSWLTKALESVKGLRRTTWLRFAGWGAPLYVALFLTAFYTITSVAAYFFLAILLLVVIIVPSSSLQDARAYAQATVIDPLRCYRHSGQEGGGARCYRVVHRGEEVARGRYVDQGPSRVLLYRSKTRDVVFAPVDGGAVLESVDTE